MSTQPTALAAAPHIPSAGRAPLSRPCENCGARAGEKCFWHCTARPTNAANRRSTAHRSAALLLTASALGAGVTGCSSTHASATPASATHSATSPAPSPARAWTGARLQQLLPTSGMFVAGITVTRTSNTGTSWIDPAHLPAPSLPTADCANTAGISAGMFTADYQAAAATETLTVDGATTVQVEDYIREALQPFLDRKIATRLDVTVVRAGIERIEAHIVMYRGDELLLDLQFADLWRGIVVSAPTG